METRRFKPRLVEVLVVGAAVLVTIYAVWVIRDVGSSTPDEGSAPPSATLEDQPSEAPSAAPSDTPSATPSPPEPTVDFPEVLGGAKRVLVIGDSTGNDPGEWVDLWAQDLAATREVTLRQWQAGAGQFDEAPVVYGSGRGMTIWNLSYPGVLPDYGQRLAEVPVAPGAILISIGHDRDRPALRRAIRATTQAIQDRWGEVPTAWVLQNPATDDTQQQQESAIAYLRSTAAATQVPVIDVYAAFREAGPLDRLLLDGKRPNDAGSRLWADTVGDLVGR